MKKLVVYITVASAGLVFASNDLLTEKAMNSVTTHQVTSFDFYVLALQWVPGWCAVGTGKSGAALDELHACQQQSSRPLMYHGFWPEKANGTYPADCSTVPELNFAKLNFENPFINYLSNADSFLNHEWSKHGTCSGYYYKGMENSQPNDYYTQVNNYFSSSLQLYNKINIPILPLEASIAKLKSLIATANPQLKPDSILVKCDADDDGNSQYLTGLWLCVDKNRHYMNCPQPLLKTSCKGQVLTR